MVKFKSKSKLELENIINNKNKLLKLQEIF